MTSSYPTHSSSMADVHQDAPSTNTADQHRLSKTNAMEQESILILETIQQQPTWPTEYSGPFDVPAEAATNATPSTFPVVAVDYALPEKPQYLCTPIAEEEWDDGEDEATTTTFDSHYDTEDDDSIVQEQRRLLAFYAGQKQGASNDAAAAAIQMVLLGEQGSKQSMMVSDEDVLREQERLLQRFSNNEKSRVHKDQKKRSKDKKTHWHGSDPVIDGPKILVRGYEKAAEAVSLGQAILRCCPYCRIVLQVDPGCRHLYCTNCEQVSHVPKPNSRRRHDRMDSSIRLGGKSLRN